MKSFRVKKMTKNGNSDLQHESMRNDKYVSKHLAKLFSLF